jgi:hypothetical protein
VPADAPAESKRRPGGQVSSAADDARTWPTEQRGLNRARPSRLAGRWCGEEVIDVPSRQYEFRVVGWLSERSRQAFPDMTVVDAPPETIIRGDVMDDSHLHGVLALIQSLGLRIVSMHEVPGRSGRT